ncbi:uncharacterized protein [Equus caballus]|uniref:uncharacterized protein isoform X1 n=1 Tax=Equus caballus TaxID=9796 RepID=UPI0038B3EEE3
MARKAGRSPEWPPREASARTKPRQARRPACPQGFCVPRASAGACREQALPRPSHFPLSSPAPPPPGQRLQVPQQSGDVVSEEEGVSPLGAFLSSSVCRSHRRQRLGSHGSPVPVCPASAGISWIPGLHVSSCQSWEPGAPVREENPRRRGRTLLKTPRSCVMRRPGCGGGELQAWRAQPGRTKSLCILQGGRVQFALDRQPAGQRRARLRDREESEAKRNMRPSSSGGEGRTQEPEESSCALPCLLAFSEGRAAVRPC